jgi:decaprenylphospho-beta-D-ribofuranose 2-oxidase
MSEPFKREALAGWGRMDPQECRHYRPERLAAIRELLNEDAIPHVIARGLGRSYGDPAVNGGGGVLNMTRLNRMIAFDAESGLLECEAGVSLAEIIEVFLPRGWFLPVTPGTKFVTLGGAIANDVHGKNHHADGAFGNFVEELALLTQAGETLTCSLSENEDVFRATLGGAGLTGIILSAKIRLIPVETAWISVDYRRAENLDDALAAMADSDSEYKYSVAWVDCLAKGGELGRSVLMRGNHAEAGMLDSRQREKPLEAPGKRAKPVPVDFPGFVLNPLSIKAFNTCFYATHPDRKGAIIDYNRYFYPLDSIQNWNRMYGKNGFVQYQATLPFESRKGLVHLLEKLSASRRASFLAVLKCFGEKGSGMLSHPIPGYTLTLDIPNRRGLIPFLRELDGILLDAGGRLYLAKDAAALPETIAAMYPELDRFRDVCRRLDPAGRLSSSMARRLGLNSREDNA